MYPLYFTAKLYSEDGQFMELGEARVSDTEYAVDFTGDFVPLLKLGTTVQIVRVLGDTEYERFVGKVYLSSRKLLQVVEISPELVKIARDYFSVNENLPVTMLLLPAKMSRFNPQKAERCSGAIRGIYPGTIKITTIDYIPEGQNLLLSIESPDITLENLTLHVRERVLMRRSAAILLCTPENPSEENARAIESFQSRQSSPELM